MRFQIWQAPVEEPFVFMNYEFAQRKVEDFPSNWESHYIKVYEDDYEDDEGYEDIGETGHPEVLESLFEIFNLNHPDDYEARSLSVSDIVVLEGKVYYCDSFSWKEVE